jgi:hypothetical protein
VYVHCAREPTPTRTLDRLDYRQGVRYPDLFQGSHRHTTSRAPAPGAPSASATTLRVSRNTPARSFGYTMRGCDDTIRRTASSTSDPETAQISHWP